MIEAEFEDGVRLNFRERILGHQVTLCFVAAAGGANNLNKIVDVLEGDLEAFEDMRTRLCLAQFELGAAIDDLAAVIDVATEHFLDVHLLRATVVECEQNDAEGAFKGGAFVELIDDDARNCATLELDDDTCCLGGLVA